MSSQVLDTVNQMVTLQDGVAEWVDEKSLEPTFRTSVCSTNRLREGRYLDAPSDQKMPEKS